MKLLRPPLSLSVALLCLLFLAAQTIFAGGEDWKEWKPIEPAELALKSPAVEKDADAEVLFWEVKVDDSPSDELVRSHYVRLKIFTERGKESQSRVDLPFLNRTKIKDIAARTIKPDGTIVELKKEDVFERTIIKAGGLRLKAKSFAMPGIEPGVIIEYRWREVSGGSGAHYMRLHFQRDIPVHRATYYVKPERSTYGMRYMPFHVPDDVRFNKEKDGYYSVTMTNLPAFREEPRMPPEDQVRSWILIYYTRAFNLSPEWYWRAIGQSIHEVLKPYTKVDDNIRKAAAEIVADAATPEQKLERIFQYCRLKIKNVSDDAAGLSEDEMEKVKTNKSPSDTLKRGIGTSFDIDMLFASLASAAGFEARLAMTGNRGDIFFDKSFANRYFLRAMSIAVRVGDRWLFYNPSLTYMPLGMLRWQSEGQQALITDSADPQWARTPISAPQTSQEKRTAKLRLSEDGTLEGDVRIEYTGQMAMEHKEYNDDDEPAEREETLRNMVKARIKTAEVSAVKIENVQDSVKPFVYEYHIRIPEYAQRTGKRLFIQPAFFQFGLGALFTASTRRYPIYFHYPWSEEDEVTIELPTGFTLDNADAPAPFHSEKISDYKVAIGFSQDQRTLIYKRSFFFGGNGAIYFPAANYELLKGYFDKVYKADTHTITLKQAATTAQTSAN